MMWYFSVKQRLHFFEPFTYVEAWSIIDQLITGLVIPFFFKSQTHFDNSVDKHITRKSCSQRTTCAKAAAKCNCRNKNSCPLGGKCLESSIVYHGSIISDDQHDGADYIGVTENTFKDRNYKHRNSSKYEGKVNSTELSKYGWDLLEE